ncbi:MAG: hypothetical protein CVV42_01830 [Candidatus Riflebacteria bacterium HGW-Riflebacteria-2]|jgi:hypothetical protein|nr:MAG: hypothetical protein CVV42_01830 [Candidatus Riflebacteria bacterium HGW-Riflebacteria-2]
MIKTLSARSGARQWLVAFAFILLATMPALAGSLNLVYEQVIKDSWGNEIGYRSTRLNSPNDLPVGSAWRNYLNLKLPDGKTIFEYARDTSAYLAQPLNLTLSDRNQTAYTEKAYSGYNLNLYGYINSFSSDSSKTFLFLHEFGHVAMLNGYPSSYRFSGLDYGDDNKHYLDEILPNENTAWVEGWANAFAAQKNNGMVFSFNLNSPSSIAFLQNNTFAEMTHNELFVSKVLYDSFGAIPSGRDKVFNTISRSGPHSSLRDFCNKFTLLYPDDKAALARILVNNSNGNITLNEILAYVNGGSRTVSRSLYDYLAQVGLVASTGSTTGTPTNTKPTTTTTTTSSTSFWGRIASWFSGLFGRAQSAVSAAPQPSVSAEPSVSLPAGGEVPTGGATAPELPGSQTNEFDSINDLARAQELYYQAFAEYNRLMADSGSDRQQVLRSRQRMQQAKERVKQLRRQMR